MLASLKFLMSQNIPTNFGFNYRYASTRISEANYKDESRGCPKLLTFGANASDQTSILFGISLIIDLKSLYKQQFHCLSSGSFFSSNENKCLSRPEEAIKA